jgi:hypothetical protein
MEPFLSDLIEYKSSIFLDNRLPHPGFRSCAYSLNIPERDKSFFALAQRRIK